MIAGALLSPVGTHCASSATIDPGLARAAARHPAPGLRLIVRERFPGTDRAEQLVRSLQGRVTQELPIVDGFSAVVPGAALGGLAASPDVLRV